MLPVILIAVGGLGGLVVALTQAIRNPEQRRLEVLSVAFAGFAVVGGVLVAIDEIQQEEALLSGADAAVATFAELTEEDSFPFIMFVFGEQRGEFTGYLQNQGSSTLFDIQARIVELPLWEQAFSEDIESETGEHLVRVPSLGPHLVMADFLNVKVPADLDRYGLNIWFQTRHGTYQQHTRFRRLETGRWAIGGAVYEWHDDQPHRLTEQFSPDFPRDECGRPEWDWPGGPDGGAEAIAYWWGECTSGD